MMGRSLLTTAATALALAMSSGLISSASAQTAVGSKGQVPTKSLGAPQPLGPVPATPPGRSQSPAAAAAAVGQPDAGGTQPTPASPTGTPSAPPTGQRPGKMPTVLVAGTVHEQAVFQSEGVFPQMDRMGAGGQIQEAWNMSDIREGVYATRLCEDCVYKVRTREFMSTTLILPEDAVIQTADLGDPTGFKVQVKAANKLAVRPSAYGLDTNLNVYTKSGAVYPFYIRSEGFNSIHVPDVIVKILGRENPSPIEGLPEPPAKGERQGKAGKPGDKATAAVRDLTNPGAASGDFVRTIPFDPSKLHGWRSYKLWGDDELRPEVVYRDDFFTYLQYGEKWDGMELATGYVTIDGIDEQVNTRVQGSTFIIESVSPLITLKDGKKFLCIKYTGETR